MPVMKGKECAVEPPPARRSGRTIELHGQRLIDEFAWMGEPYTLDMQAHLQAENAYAQAIMAPHQPLIERLYEEIVSRIDDHEVMTRRGSAHYHYYARFQAGVGFPVEYRLSRQPGAIEEITLDLNALAGGAFVRLGVFQVSDDERYLAYAVDLTGTHRFTLYLKDLADGHVQLIADHVRTAAWPVDSRYLYYTVDGQGGSALERYFIPAAIRTRIYEEGDPAFRLRVSRTSSGAYLLLRSGSLTSVEYRFLSAADPTGAWAIVAPRRSGLHYEVEHRGSRFYIRTNDRGPNMRLVETEISDPSPSAWKEMVPCRADVALQEVAVFKDYLALFESVAGEPRIRVRDFRSGASYDVPFPDPICTVRNIGARGGFMENRLHYHYESPSTPLSAVEYDLDSRTGTKTQSARMNACAADKYRCERVWVTAPDGVRIPMTLVYGSAFRRDGMAPGSLYGYGAYGNSASVTLSPAKMSLLDRGVLIAVAHVRGGGELGKAWHDEGRLQNKPNSFTDFLACAQHLAEHRYVRPGSLIIHGASAGGLLVSAVANMRPDLFRAVVATYPFLDVLNTMLDESQPMTVREFDEWGNPHEPDAFRTILSYCPYMNISRQAYPATLVRTALFDRQVMYWEGPKYVAKLRQHTTSGQPIILLTNMAAGHGGASGRDDGLRDTAAECAFMLWQWGLS